MNTNRCAHGRSSRRNQAGFALVLAILALMLLTFLGLTLAATSSTELQIATNYRWSQQAFYNAEAGLEVAKLIMSDWPVNADFIGILPPKIRSGLSTPPTWTLAEVATAPNALYDASPGGTTPLAIPSGTTKAVTVTTGVRSATGWCGRPAGPARPTRP